MSLIPSSLLTSFSKPTNIAYLYCPFRRKMPSVCYSMQLSWFLPFMFLPHIHLSPAHILVSWGPPNLSPVSDSWIQGHLHLDAKLSLSELELISFLVKLFLHFLLLVGATSICSVALAGNLEVLLHSTRCFSSPACNQWTNPIGSVIIWMCLLLL